MNRRGFMAGVAGAATAVPAAAIAKAAESAGVASLLEPGAGVTYARLTCAVAPGKHIVLHHNGHGVTPEQAVARGHVAQLDGICGHRHAKPIAVGSYYGRNGECGPRCDYMHTHASELRHLASPTAAIPMWQSRLSCGADDKRGLVIYTSIPLTPEDMAAPTIDSDYTTALVTLDKICGHKHRLPRMPESELAPRLSAKAAQG